MVEAWKEKCLIAVTKRDSTTPINLYLHALTEDVMMNDGGRPVSITPLTNSGNLTLSESEKESTVEFTAYTTGIGDPTPSTAGHINGFDQLFFGTDCTYASSRYSVNTPADQGWFRVVILWTDNPTQSDPCGSVATGYESYRKGYANGKLTDLTATFTGQPKVYKVNAKFTFAPTNKYGVGNLMREEGISALNPSLAAIQDYTNTIFDLTSGAISWHA